MVSIDLTKIPGKKAIAIIMVSFAIIIAPYWFLFQYCKKLFETTSLINLLLISISIGFPLFLFNTVLIIGKSGNKYKTKYITSDPWFFWVAIGSVWTIFVLYSPAFIYLSDNILELITKKRPFKVIPQRIATGACIFAEILVVISFPFLNKIIDRIYRKKQVQIKDQKTPGTSI